MKKLKNIFSALFVVFLLIVSVPLSAQNNDSSSTTSSAEDEDELVVTRNRIPDAPNSRSSSNKQDRSKSNDGAAGKVFKPTEEISEDLPVPFPVDI